MSGTVVLNPATVDGYGNPISIARDDGRGVNRVFTTSTIENIPDTITVIDGYGNPISFVRDEEKDANRLLTSSTVENFPTSIIVTDGYENPISITRDDSKDVNRMFTSSTVENFPSAITATDGYGNPISVARDNDINRVYSSTIVEGQAHVEIFDADENPVTVLLEDDGYTAPSVNRMAVNIGSPNVGIRGTPTFVIGQEIPTDFGDYLQSFVLDSEGGKDLNVNGSVTPVEFTVDADAYRDVQVNELRVALTCQDIIMDGGSFCSSPTLTNGVSIEVISSGNTYVVFNIQQNEDWLFFNSPAGLTLNNTGPKDLMSAGFYFGKSMILHSGSDDKVKVTIRDNLTGNQMPSFFRIMVFGIYL